MSTNTEQMFLQRSLRIAGVVALYWFVSISMVFLNKHLLSDVNLDAPMFVTWFQCVVAVIACYVLGSLRSVHPLMQMFPKFEFNMEIAKQVLPLSIVFVGMIAFNNLTLKFVGVAFYNVGRSLTTIFNVALSYVMLNQSTSLNAILMCTIIVGGFFLGVDQEKEEADLSFTGVMCGVLASVCVALNSIFIKKVLPIVDGDMWRLTAYNNANALALFVPVMYFMNEFPAISASEEIFSTTYWSLMIIAGLFGIAIGLVTMLQIQVTSPLTHNISGTSKACAQTILALQLQAETRSFNWWLGNFMVLGGSFGYAAVKRAEMRQQLQQAPGIDSKV